MNTPLDPLAPAPEADDDLLNSGRLATDVRMTIFRPEQLARSPQRGCRVALDWAELVEWLARPIVADDKAGSGGFSCATFKNDDRHLANVEHVSAIALDIDTGSADVASVSHALTLYRSVVYPTFSSTVERPRCRAIVALSRPVSAKEYALLWDHVRANLAAAGVELDRAARDASRLWFVPTVRAGGSFELAHHDGETIDVDKVLSVEAEHLARLERELREHAAHTLGATPSIDRVRRYIGAIPVAVAGQHGHDRAFRAACVVVANVADPATQVALLAEYSARCVPPWSAKELRHKLDSARRADLRPLSNRRPS